MFRFLKVCGDVRGAQKEGTGQEAEAAARGSDVLPDPDREGRDVMQGSSLFSVRRTHQANKPHT